MMIYDWFSGTTNLGGPLWKRSFPAVMVNGSLWMIHGDICQNVADFGVSGNEARVTIRDLMLSGF